MYTTIGIVPVTPSGQRPGWYHLQCDSSLSDYYLWHYQRGLRGWWASPLNGVHVTFIAGEKEPRIISGVEMAGLVGKEFTIQYEGVVYTNGRAFWLPAWSDELDGLRSRLGLPLRERGYHITLGNIKGEPPKGQL